MSKHTPGPWSLNARGDNVIGANGTTVRVWNLPLSYGERTDESEANSRVALAAPELLKELEHAANCLEEISKLSHGNNEEIYRLAYYGSALALIRKAKGE